ncbi:OmpA family protein [Oceanibium sediminis]|uniref:OmpA family protein n=1 Tax=Oceanibium sediminis TaxID=2026339 RepID=UPI000DD3BD2D|nr:OmpA family protein [Oceanibium sediminis]
MLTAKLPVTLAAVSALGLAACTNPDGSANRTGTGALIGAAGGAIAGRVIGNDTKGTVIGAAIGAAVGGGVGAVLDKQERDLRRDLSGSGARIVNTGSELVVVLPEAITFDVDSTQVKNNSRANIRAIARNLQDYPNSRVAVIGHTDNTGSSSYNQTLSVNRARAVAAILTNNGVARGRVRTIGRGETQPVASNGTASGRQQNRRVEIVITPTT